MPTAKGYKGIGMEGVFARFYDKNVQKNLKDYQEHAQEVAKSINPNDKVLEIAPGPGYSAIELAKLGNYQITGVDISKTLVEIARYNASTAEKEIDFTQGGVANMSFADSTFDHIYCRAAFKNFALPVEALNEMYRVLKPGKKAVITDLRKDISNRMISDYVQDMKLGFFNTIITRMIFKRMLVKRAYTRQELESLIGQSAFDDKYEIVEKSTEIELWLEK
jgi:ubiquinone/menaquinone biosynthesis C-methylase UbiE